jgi:hypothetical protein
MPSWQSELNARPLDSRLGMEYHTSDNLTVIFAGRQPLKPGIGISSGFYYKGEQFQKPSKIGITLYRESGLAKWDKIKSIVLSFRGQKHNFAAKYEIQNDKGTYKTPGAASWPATEMLYVEIPVGVAKQISTNNGMLVTSEPSGLYLEVPASNLASFQALVATVDNAPTPEKFDPYAAGSAFSRTGLPITETYDNGIRGFVSTPIYLPGDVGVFAMTVTSHNGKKVPSPYTSLSFMSFSAQPRWSGETSVTLSFGGRKLMLQGEKSTEQKDGLANELLIAEIPHKDFLALAKSRTFYFTIGDATMTVTPQQMAGIKALAAKK